MRNKSGFTLLEVLIALTIFVVVVSLTTMVMRQSFGVEEKVTQVTDELTHLELALSEINRDTKELVLRATRGNDMHLFPPFIGQEDYLEFTRKGVINPNSAAKISNMQRVAYLCSKGNLIRRAFIILDTPNRKLYQDNILLKSLSACKFAYLDQNGSVVATWGQQQPNTRLNTESIPKALYLSLNLTKIGKMNLHFIFPEEMYGN